MSPLPLPGRLAAGLAATAVDQARKLPTPWARFDEEDDMDRNDDVPADVPVDVPADVPPDVPVEIDEADVAQALTPDPAASGSGPPPVMPGYDELTLAQLRAKLRTLSVEQLGGLLEHEQRHENRAAFVTMLGNRITTVRSR
jgi:hypothetical protein